MNRNLTPFVGPYALGVAAVRGLGFRVGSAAPNAGWTRLRAPAQGSLSNYRLKLTARSSWADARARAPQLSQGVMRRLIRQENHVNE